MQAALSYNTNQAEIALDARFTKQIFASVGASFCVFLYDVVDEHGDTTGTTTCIGENLPQTKGIIYRFDGRWQDSRYGRQFKVASYTERLGSSKADIVGYFKSNLFKGVGKKKAEAIYNTFGPDTFEILEKNPKKLKEVKELKPEVCEKIIETFEENRSVARVYALVKGVANIGLKSCVKICEKFKEETEDIIQKHPFRLCEINGIDFLTVDPISRYYSLPDDSYERMQAASIHVLKENEISGNLAMDLQDFGNALKKLLASPAVTNDKINSFICKALTDPFWKKLTFKKVRSDTLNVNYIYRTCTFEAEKSVASNVSRLIAKKNTFDMAGITKEYVAQLGNSYGIDLDDSQIDAVMTVLSNPFSIITGGPGTGKTTILKVIADIFKSKNKEADVLFVAPTGRAARKINESTGFPARTIHSRLGLRDTASISAGKAEDVEPIEEGLVVVDESSMIDIWIAKALFEAIQHDTKVVLVGDADQLQSVGAGAVFRDLISSEAVPVSSLSHVFRQKDGCILENAKRIKEGNTDILTGTDFEIHDGIYGKELEDAMVTVYLKDIKTYGLENVVCLCPVKQHEAGVYSMNERLQEAINPRKDFVPECKIGGRYYRLGDLVMELQNHEEVSNGDVGKVIDVCGTAGEESVTVRYFDSTEIKYEGEDLARLTLAYAMTVHKAQGSEYSSVITCLQDQNFHMLIRNIPYTAFTRGKNIVRFFGSKNALNKAILQPDTNRRKTLLSHYLAMQHGKREEFV